MNIIPSLFIVSLISSLDLFSHKVYAAEECVDQPGAVVLDGMETCEWVGAHNPKYRCGLDNSENACKFTCGTCECHDRRTFEGQFRGKTFRCGRLNRMPKKRSKIYCKKVPGAIENCQATCKDECQAPTTPASWTQLGSEIFGEAAGDESGHSVSLSSDGTRVAISNGNYKTARTVRIYEYDGSSWDQLGSDISGEKAGDWFGFSVSLSSDGKRVAIGAHLNDGNGSDSGSTRIYEYDGSAWTQLGSVIYGKAANNISGTSVSLSSDGGRVAIGAPRNTNGNGGTNSGQVRVYEYDGSSWIQLGSDIDGEQYNERAGDSVSLSEDGTRVAIGAPFNSGNGSRSGTVRIYEYDGSSWGQLGSDIYGEAGDYAGYSTSLSGGGGRVAIGASGNDVNGYQSGQVRIYDYIGSSWTQVGSNIDGEEAFDSIGNSVSLSSDGRRVATGAFGPNGNGYNAGSVRIYEYDGSSWSKLGSDIDGEAANDRAGFSVSLSGEGGQVAFGAIWNDGNGPNSGSVSVFSYE